MSGPDYEEYDYHDKQDAILASQAHLCEYMAQTLVIFREFIKRYPNAGCPQTMTLENQYTIILKMNEKA